MMQSQKLESIGRLAGGVAHDFNNMLQVILGNIDLILEDYAADSELIKALSDVKNAAKSSANLTRQLLAFAGNRRLRPKTVSLNTTISRLLNMLQRLIGENLQLVWQPDPQLWTIKIDPSQVEQILVNLVINARDASDETGRIVIETQNVRLEREGIADEIAPGNYIRLRVSDEGCGMDSETLSHIFEPFYTSKPVGAGTGLGLATVYGIVKQNNGHIHVYSEPAQGTVFNIYLPCVDQDEPAEDTQEKVEILRGNSERILIVEDEAAILNFGSKLLNRWVIRF